MPITVHQRRPTFEAVQYQPGTNCAEVGDFLGHEPHPPGECDPQAPLKLKLWDTPVLPGEWILRNQAGNMLICSAETFTDQYEPA